MRKIAVLAFLAVSLTGFGKDVSWYKCFKGRVGEYPITMHINRYGSQVTGHYYYDKFMQPLTVLGSAEGDSLKLLAYSNSYEGERFNGTLSGSTFSGGWDSDNGSYHSFTLEEDKKLSSMFEYVYVTGEKVMFKNFEKSPTATYLEGTIWPADDNPGKNILRRMIINEKSFPSNTTSPGTVMLKQRDNFFKGWLRENSALTKKDIEDLGYTSMYNAAEEDYLRPVYFDKNIFVFSRFSYAYTGGAHGNYGTGYSVYDINTAKRLELSGIITDKGIKNLPALLEKNYRLQHKVPDTQPLSEAGLFADTIYPNDNFVLTPGGLMFSYVPYEIGPYAAGEIIIYIPLNEAEKYLKPAALKLIR